MSGLRLYEITSELDVIRNWIEEHEAEIIAAEGALPDELAELLAETEGEFREKAERVALYVRELMANARAVKEETERLAGRQRHYEKAAEGLKRYLLLEGLKRYLLLNMEASDIQKIEGTLVTVRVQKSPPSVVGTPSQDQMDVLYSSTAPAVSLVPATYRFDSREYIAAWKAGKAPAIEGVSVVQNTHLRIA